MNMFSRRKLIKSTALAGIGLAGVGERLRGSSFSHSAFFKDESKVRLLVNTILDSTISAGANYADVRLTHNYASRVTSSMYKDNLSEAMTVGVRSLVNGCWGFVSSTVWDNAEGARMGIESVKQAKLIAAINRRDIAFEPIPLVKDQTFNLESEIAPLSIDPEEVKIHCDALLVYAENYMRSNRVMMDPVPTGFSFDQIRQEVTFGSTDGAYLTQSNFITGGQLTLGLNDVFKSGRKVAVSTDIFTYSRTGLERLFSPQIRESIKQVIDEMILDVTLDRKPVDVGRYTVLMDQSSMSRLVGQSIGMATEHDRIMGSEANAGGTSYINDLDEMLGSLRIGNDLLNISANRTEPGGAATVKWDDEGVSPKDFTLVKDGILTGVSTSREWATHLNNDKSSNGCLSMGFEPDSVLGGGGAINPPMVQVPNLVMDGNDSNNDFDAMIRDIDNGIAFKGVNFDMDFQQLNGLGSGGHVYEVRSGKIVSKIVNAAALVRAPELWNSMISTGGDSQRERIGLVISKGEPSQRFFHSVTVPCVTFKDVAIIDITKRA